MAGLSDSQEILLTGRALQGVGAALIAPAALTILMRLFAGQPAELGKAFGFWGASAAAGGTADVFLGGVITEWMSWSWTFLINLPLGLAVLAAGPSYEEIGLVRSALRAYSGYRVYSDKHIATLRFVRRARDLGFQVKQIASLLDLWQNGSRSSADVKSLATAHVRELEERRRQLDAMIATLDHLAHHCHGDHRPDCPILQGLSAEDPTPQGAALRKVHRPTFAAA